MKWGIITDSSCDLKENIEGKDIYFDKVPFIINIGTKSFIDGEQLDVIKFVDEMENCSQAGQTACPSPGTWYDFFAKADEIIAITISSKLSGSFNSAQTAKNMMMEDEPHKKIFILDSCSAGPGLALLVMKAQEYICKGLSFDNVVKKLTKYAEHMHTFFVLSSFNNLVKNGRMSKLTGYIAGKLNLQGIGIEKDGLIKFKQKVRGYQRAIESLLSDMKENGVSGDRVIISHCQNVKIAEMMHSEICKVWKDVKVIILETGGLCSYYAEKKGVIVSY